MDGIVADNANDRKTLDDCTKRSAIPAIATWNLVKALDEVTLQQTYKQQPKERTEYPKRGHTSVFRNIQKARVDHS